MMLFIPLSVNGYFIFLRIKENSKWRGTGNRTAKKCFLFSGLIFKIYNNSQIMLNITFSSILCQTLGSLYLGTFNVFYVYKNVNTNILWLYIYLLCDQFIFIHKRNTKKNPCTHSHLKYDTS